MQPDSCRKIKLDLIFNCMGSFEFGGDKSFMMQSPLFLCETKMGFSKCSVLWKVGSGFETPTSPRAPLYEKAVQKDNVWGRGAGCEGKGQNLRGSSSSSRVCAGLCLVCFSWMVLSLELWGFGYFIKNWAVSEQIDTGKAEILFPKAICCGLGYIYIFASS